MVSSIGVWSKKRARELTGACSFTDINTKAVSSTLFFHLLIFILRQSKTNLRILKAIQKMHVHFYWLIIISQSILQLQMISLDVRDATYLYNWKPQILANCWEDFFSSLFIYFSLFFFPFIFTSWRLITQWQILWIQF